MAMIDPRPPMPDLNTLRSEQLEIKVEKLYQALITVEKFIGNQNKMNTQITEAIRTIANI